MCRVYYSYVVLYTISLSWMSTKTVMVSLLVMIRDLKIRVVCGIIGRDNSSVVINTPAMSGRDVSCVSEI